MTCGLKMIKLVCLLDDKNKIPFCANKRGAMIRLAGLKPKQLTANAVSKEFPLKNQREV